MKIWTHFLPLFGAVLVLAGGPLALLMYLSARRNRRPGCSGNHECIEYKGEKLMCPACELRERQREKTQDPR